MKIRTIAFLLMLLGVVRSGQAVGLPEAPVGLSPGDVCFAATADAPVDSPEVRQAVMLFAAGYDPGRFVESLRIMHPLHGALFPADLAPPVITWVESHPQVGLWLVSFRISPARALYVLCREPSYEPPEAVWKPVREASLGHDVPITVYGIDAETLEIVSQDVVSVASSRDRIDALIMYRQLPPVFSKAQKRLDLLGGRLGDPASPKPPRTLFQGVPGCVGCHSFSRDGMVFGMDLDHAGDKGGYILADTRREMDLTAGELLSWNDFPKIDDRQTTGLYARITPDGRHVIGTVNEIALLIKMDDPYSSQLFFPYRGVLVAYSRAQGRFFPVPGADDPGYVQTCADIRPDGGHIAFARTATQWELIQKLGTGHVFARPQASLHELNAAYPVQFDIYHVPFDPDHRDRPAVAEPLPGAGGNGMSNYNPRYSPDGRWIVFTQSRSGLVLQPDSRLYAIPATGGVPRRMTCNLGVMNSWHSFSPNGRWLLFVSKETGADSRIWITHFDRQGRDSVPVMLHRFGEPGLACNVPEFVDKRAGRMERISFPAP
ncbi:TolB family protein [Desulfolutivibrio sp.]|uniref:TolB family protein n=1 Tax=Desulfolutivibrio sp. TaxID=2773296 RepID=UPI002F966740